MPHFELFLDFLFAPPPLRCAHHVKRRFLLSAQPHPYAFSAVTVTLLQLCWRNQVGGGGGWFGKRSLLFARKYLGVIRKKTRSEQHALNKKNHSTVILFFPLLSQNYKWVSMCKRRAGMQNKCRFTASPSLLNSILTAIITIAHLEKWYWETGCSQ